MKKLIVNFNTYKIIAKLIIYNIFNFKSLVSYLISKKGSANWI